ncbi:MAG: ABC transporter permease [Nanoarchaeota archaeon]
MKLKDVIAARLPIMSKALADLRREKTIILLMILLAFILLSVSVLVATVTFVYNPEYLLDEPLKVGVVDSPQLFLGSLRSSKIQIVQLSSHEMAMEQFQSGDVDGLFLVQQKAGPDQPAIVRVVVPEDPVRSSIFMSLAKPLLEDIESRLQERMRNSVDLIWMHEVQFALPRIKGAHTIFEIIIGLLLPLIILVPSFILGNLFVDNVSQEFEEQNMQLIIAATSPMRFIHEYLLMGMLMNIFFVTIFLFIIFLRFDFILNAIPIFLYAMLFCSFILIFSLLSTFVFRKKEVAQIVYSFGILSIFLLSPFFRFSPLHTIADMLLGNIIGVGYNILALAVVIIILYGMLRAFVRVRYYA